MNLTKAIESYQKQIGSLQITLSELEKIQKYADTVQAIALEEVICKRYLQLGVAEAVAKEVNSAGFRKNGKIYTNKDITNIIGQKALKNVEHDLHRGAYLLLKINKHKI